MQKIYVEGPKTKKPPRRAVPKSLINQGLKYGAGTKSRTRDLLITSQLLYQLSYAGKYITTVIWLGYQDSNLGMPIPKTGALPLGDTPAIEVGVVARDGIEPPTRGFSIPCSTN